ncbi:MAG TPA: tetratricopeptide repeat protein [Polyangia bacterium]|nr:tetratricopeptide repeat protein [Polyangia bacterium]
MIFRALLMVGLLAAPSVAAADALSEADAAYTRVDFAETERLAQAALAGADHDRGQMIRIYFLLGVSAAAEGKDEEAIDAFKHLLALDPATKVDRDLSPKLQGPMLEARGTPPAPLACDAVFDRAKGVLQLTIGDQLKLSREAVVRWRLSPGGAFTEVRRPSAPSVDVTIPGGAGAGRVEYSYSLVDDRRNRLFEKGSDAAPEVSQAAAGARSQPSAPPPERKIRTKWLVLGIIGEVLGVAGLAGGIGAYFVGQSAADRWNNDSICLANGMTRSANCAADRSSAQAAGNGSIASFAVGGALIAASTILLIVAPRDTRERTVAKRLELDCGAGPGIVGLACGARF